MDSQESTLRQFLRDRFANYHDQIGRRDPLDDVVDSLGLFELVEFVEKEFSVSIPNAEFSPKRFDTIEAILGLVEEYAQSVALPPPDAEPPASRGPSAPAGRERG